MRRIICRKLIIMIKFPKGKPEIFFLKKQEPECQ